MDEAVEETFPLTITTCGIFQFAGVKVRFAVDGNPALVFDDVTGIVTLAVGMVSSVTTNVVWPPAALVNNPEVRSMQTPGVGAVGE